MLHDIPSGITDWLGQFGGGALARLERAVARREAWRVDMTRPDGATMEGFLRLNRTPDVYNPWSLRKEVEIVRALARSTVSVTEIYGSSDELACVLFERLGCRADLHNVDTAQQHARMSDFMDVNRICLVQGDTGPMNFMFEDDRATCQAIAEAMGIELGLLSFPAGDEGRDPLAEAASWALKTTSSRRPTPRLPSIASRMIR